MSAQPSIAFYNILLNRPASLGNEEVSFYTDLFSEVCVAASAARENGKFDGAWTVSWLFLQKPEISWLTEQANLLVPHTEIADQDWRIEPIFDDVDWLAESYRQLPPFAVDRFYISGSHHNGPVPEGLIGLQIDAATAFGSGAHGTTAGCIRLMCGLKAHSIEPKRVLDMGTGSGILAVAAAKLWGVAVLAVDNDEECVRVTGHHAALNNVADMIKGVHGEGFATRNVKADAPYDLVIANILPAPLIEMAQDLCRSVEPGGHVILSGILDEQVESVLAVYEGEGCGMNAVQRHSEEGWTSLLLQKPL